MQDAINSIASRNHSKDVIKPPIKTPYGKSYTHPLSQDKTTKEMSQKISSAYSVFSKSYEAFQSKNKNKTEKTRISQVTFGYGSFDETPVSEVREQSGKIKPKRPR